MSQPVRQVPDDPALFEELLRREQAAPELYRPTNYWSSYAEAFVPELRQQGLRDFRRRRNSVLDSFGASDPLPACRVDWSLPFLRWLADLAQIRGVWRLARPVRDAIEHAISRVAVPQYSQEAAVIYFHALVAKKFKRFGIDLDTLATDRVGNPQGVVDVDGALWSWIHLGCASLLGDALGSIDLERVDTVVELGGGLGRNVLMLARLRPAATILCFDIMPQAYVANQYLKTVLPDRVVSIERGIDLKLTDGDISPIRGKILVLPAWKMPEYRDVAIDLFWNAASFQEMEPDVVHNYLALVKCMAPRWITIMAMPGGNYWGEWKPGRGGTRQPVANSIYFDSLAPEYVCVFDEPADMFLRALDHRLWIFGKSAFTGNHPSADAKGAA